MGLWQTWLKSWNGKQPERTDVKPENKPQEPTFEHILGQFRDCSDLTHRSFPNNGVNVLYFTFLVGNDELLREIVEPFSRMSEREVSGLLSGSFYTRVDDAKMCVEGVLYGKAAVFYAKETYLVDVAHPVGRSIEQSETEGVIAGPHDGFVENIAQNLSVLRQRIRSSHLKTIRLTVGEVTKTEVVLVYLEGIANEENVRTLTERIRDIEIDGVFEGNMFVQLIDDNPNSVFPQFMTTERPDAVASKIIGGRIAGIVEGSPSVFCCPTAFFDFFGSPDDYYHRWLLGTAVRILRFVGFMITIGFTAFYVSVTTFHYDMIPHTMLLNLTESRSKVPFPPLMEALLMETTIELLREAGARLPTKIGQTIGIVGGIVIGQASVQAGFTSNILIIAVATSAIASFVIPSYVMSGSIRLIRFGLIILAGMLGNLGLTIGIGLVIIHLAGITNLGASYLTPIAPKNSTDFLDTFVRGPLWAIRKRPSISRSSNTIKNKMRK
ncbi:spore germination protein [Paenibacillus ginsengarvi]|uniref:Spore germination protein n=1 Tax=Paenibacillus ginsengarvi TaxID=400777 RepID=A0A3B0C379_9BACL|nr:spore germination protein [Paenibacillus ginsengarvi]RKN80605.1 spore germination protein [Paenibacillus ginsengarvi]